jgi:hypothetical protein
MHLLLKCFVLRAIESILIDDDDKPVYRTCAVAFGVSSGVRDVSISHSHVLL